MILSLYARAAGELRAAGVGRCLVATTDRQHHLLLPKLGFRKRGEAALFIHLGERLADLDPGTDRNWFVGRADSDWDQYPGALAGEKA